MACSHDHVFWCEPVMTAIDTTEYQVTKLDSVYLLRNGVTRGNDVLLAINPEHCPSGVCPFIYLKLFLGKNSAWSMPLFVKWIVSYSS